MGYSDSLFNAAAKRMELTVRWYDENIDGEIDDHELISVYIDGDGQLYEHELPLDQQMDLVRDRLDGAERDLFSSGGTAEKRDTLEIGNPAVLPELMKLLESHGKSTAPLGPIHSSFTLEAPITRTIRGGVDLNGDRYADYVMVESYEIYIAPEESDRHRTVSFISAIYGNSDSSRTGEPSENLIKGALLIDVAAFAGDTNPINNVVFTKDQEDGTDVVNYDRFENDVDGYVTSAFTGRDINFSPQALSNALFDVHAR